MKKKIDVHSLVLKAIMERYGGLTDLYEDMREDVDTVLVNLEDDLKYKVSTDDIYKIIQSTRGLNY